GLSHASEGGRILRLAVVLPRPAPGPATSGSTSGAERQGPGAGRAGDVAPGVAGDDFLHGEAVSREVPRRWVRGTARVLEPQPARGLRGDPGAPAARGPNRRVRGLHDRVRHS